jgi:FixJ family two-component response regulator
VANPTPIVFVVDDDVSVGESLEALISTEGWRAECFASARDFLAHPRAGTPSCLILDVSLPDLNGLDLQKQLAGERLDMPIIFITGYGDIPMTVRAMRAGAVEFLTKPVAEDALLGAIRHAIEHGEAARRGRASGAARLLRLAQPPRTRGHGAGGCGPSEQAGRRRTGDQRDHREGAPRPGDGEDEGPLAGRFGEPERQTAPRARDLKAAPVMEHRHLSIDDTNVQ